MKPISIRPSSAPPVACHDEIGSDLHVVGGSSIVKIHANGSHTHMHTHTLVAAEDNDIAGEANDTTVAAAAEGKDGEERKKASIVVDVIIEAIFIVGKTVASTFIQSLAEV